VMKCSHLTSSSSKRHRSRSAVWPASSTDCSTTCKVASSPMHVLQQEQQHPHLQQQQLGLSAQAGNENFCQGVTAAVKHCCGQPDSSVAVGVSQPRQQAWQQQQQPLQHQDLQHLATYQDVQQQQQWHQPQPPCQPRQQPSAWRQQASHQHQQQVQQQQVQQLPQQYNGSTSNSTCSSSTSGSPLRHSSRGGSWSMTDGSLLQPLLPQQPSEQLQCSGSAAAAAAEQPQSSTVLRRPGSPIAQVLCALACHAAAPRAAGSADPLKEPLLGQ
jgi:phenylpyruvate tautomerase PptA (4-oxalocrotonate tautomerase family)